MDVARFFRMRSRALLTWPSPTPRYYGLFLGIRRASGELIVADEKTRKIQHTRTARRLRIKGTFFADCSGDATVGFFAKADYQTYDGYNMGASNLWSVLDAGDKAQVLKCECKDKTALSKAVDEGLFEQPFPRCPWAVDLADKPFPGRIKKDAGDPPHHALGDWMWESGFEADQ